jgi:hypothetical protein
MRRTLLKGKAKGKIATDFNGANVTVCLTRLGAEGDGILSVPSAVTRKKSAFS